MFFTRFNFAVTYCPGTKNIKADALSRQTDQTSYPKTEENIIPETLLVAPVQWDIMTEIAQINRQNPPPRNCPPELSYVPETLRKKLLQQVHNFPSSGHPGINATIQLLKNRFWWSAMSTDTITFVNACNTSKSAKVCLTFAEEEVNLKLQKARVKASMEILQDKKEAAAAEAEALEAEKNMEKNSCRLSLNSAPVETTQRTEQYVIDQTKV